MGSSQYKLIFGGRKEEDGKVSHDNEIGAFAYVYRVLVLWSIFLVQIGVKSIKVQVKIQH